MCYSPLIHEVILNNLLTMLSEMMKYEEDCNLIEEYELTKTIFKMVKKKMEKTRKERIKNERKESH